MSEHNNSIGESANQIPITAYLSYRQRNPHNATALELLEKHCSDQHIKLVYDKQEIKPGESIKAFMDELASARCIFIFLQPDYFESAYTLYELVTIDQWADLDRRFIHPIRVTENMNAYQWTNAKKYWEENETIRDELARLLNTDPEAAWQQIETVWKNVISPYLDKLHPSLEHGDKDKILGDYLIANWAAIQSAVAEEKELLHSTIKREVTEILKTNFVALDKLAREISLAPGVTANDIAQHWVDESELENAIAVLTRVIQDKREKLKFSNPEQWGECHSQAIQIGGWLLINSVDPNWWFNHQLKMKQLSKKSISRRYSLTHPPYIEVIVSRSLLQQARFKLDSQGNAQPANGNDDMALFDSISPNATEIQLLAPIYKDLHKSEQYPPEPQKLRDGIYTRAKSHFNVNRRPIYYLMSEATLKLFENQTWYPEVSQRSAEYIQFVCFNQSPSKDTSSPYHDPKSLLDQYATLLSLK